MASLNEIGAYTFFFKTRSKSTFAKNGCFLIYSAPLEAPNLSLGFILKSPRSKDFASGDRSYGIGTGLVVIFFKI